MRKLHCNNFTPIVMVVVCIKNFIEHFTIHKDRIKQDGIKLCYARGKKISLTKNVKPIKENITAYLNGHFPTK